MNNLTSLRNQKGLSMRDVAKELDLPYTTYVNYEKGVREPSSEVLIKIADYYGTTVDFLIGRSDGSSVFDIPNIIPVPKMRKIPLLGTIACGEPILAAENIEDEVDIPENIHADFALRCKGDSMVGAEIYDGDIVYIRQQPTVLNGQIAAVLIEDEATLKRFYYNETAGRVTLNAENPDFEPLVYTGEEINHIRILGRAVGLTREI